FVHSVYDYRQLSVRTAPALNSPRLLGAAHFLFRKTNRSAPLGLLDRSAPVVLQPSGVRDLEEDCAAIRHRTVAIAPDGARWLIDEVILFYLIGCARIGRILEHPYVHLGPPHVAAAVGPL